MAAPAALSGRYANSDSGHGAPMHNDSTEARTGGPRPSPFKERRQPPGRSALARLRWLRGLVLRPFQLRWQRGPRLVWAERRRTSADAEMTRLRADLHAEMLTLPDSALVLHELLHVDDVLRRAGWTGLAALPAATRLRARLQVEILAGSSGSAPLAGLARRLKALERVEPLEDAAAASRGSPPVAALPDAAPEVLELSEDAYAEAEQRWASSQPAPLAPPDPDLKA